MFHVKHKVPRSGKKFNTIVHQMRQQRHRWRALVKLTNDIKRLLRAS